MRLKAHYGGEWLCPTKQQGQSQLGSVSAATHSGDKGRAYNVRIPKLRADFEFKWALQSTLFRSDGLAMNTKSCRYCGSEIAARASLCPVCKNYQSALRNNLVFFAGLTGFFTLLATGLVLIPHLTLSTYRLVMWRDSLDFLEISKGIEPSYLTAVLSNSGYGPVFASTVEIYWRGGNTSHALNRIVRVNEIEVIREGDPVERKPFDLGFVSNQTGKPSKETLEATDIANLHQVERACVRVIFMDTTNAHLDRMRPWYETRGRKLVLDPAEGKLFFFSTYSGARIQINFPLLASFVQKNTPECQKIRLQ
jgi:hypothetical protein